MDHHSGTPMLRPLRFGELLDAGFRLWRQHFRALTGVSLILTMPVAVLIFLWQLAVVVSVTDSGLYLVNDPDSFNSISSLFNLLQLALTGVAAGAVFFIAGRAYVGPAPSLADAAATGTKRLLPFIGLGLMFLIPFFVLLAIGGAGPIGFLILAVGGTMLAVSFSHAPNAFWEERRKATESIGRSFDLVRGRRWTVFGVLVVAFLLVVLLQFVYGAILIASILGSVGTGLLLAVTTIGGQLVSAIILPIGPSLVTAAYYDARVRKEGFDLELAARHLDEPPPEDTEPPLIR